MDTSSDSIRAVGEADLLEIARVARSTWKNWIGQGLVEEPSDGLYRERDVVEAVVVTLLVGCLDLRRAKGVWLPARTATVDRCSALPLTGSPSLHAVVDLHTWGMHLATGAPELFAAVNPAGGFPRGFVVVALSAVVLDAQGILEEGGSGRRTHQGSAAKAAAAAGALTPTGRLLTGRE